MMRSIGLLEMSSIAGGVEVCDYMIKASEVELIFAKPVCPGKYLVLITGDVGAVEASAKVGLEIGRGFVVNSLVIPRVHPSLFPAIGGTAEIAAVDALGVVEYFDVTSAIIGADVAAKSSSVFLMDIRLGIGVGGKSFFCLTGSVSDVTSAVETSIASAKEKGILVNYCVIPSPGNELYQALM